MTAHVTGDGQDPPAEPPRPAAPEPDINPLQRLIRHRLGERGWSYGEVARRGSLPRSTVYTLATTRNLTRPPRPDTIDALAKGLDVPVAVVRAAAAASTGLHYYDQAPAGRERPGDPDRELLIASIDELTPEDRRHVAALVESLRNSISPPAGRLAPAPSSCRRCRFRRFAERAAGIGLQRGGGMPYRARSQMAGLAGRQARPGGEATRPAARRRQTVVLRFGWQTAPGRLPGRPARRGMHRSDVAGASPAAGRAWRRRKRRQRPCGQFWRRFWRAQWGRNTGQR